MAQLIFALGTFVILGFVWFFVARPALEGLGFLPTTVNSIEDEAPAVMSRSEDEGAGLSASSLQTQAQTDRQTGKPAPLPREIMVDICQSLRAHGYGRDEARSLLRKMGQPLDNNVWADSIPPEPQYRTPIAGRATGAAFDADFPYEAPPA